MSTLFTPKLIGSVEVPNRIVMPSMTTRSADAEGHVTDDTIAYFVARARGGVGLVTVEMASPEKVGRHRHHELGIYDDRFLPGLSRLVQGIRDAGARTAIQLGHGGGHTREDICGETPIAPSAVPHDVFEGTMQTIVPQEMSRDRIAQTTDAFVAAAARAAEAGFDCVEIHAAHGYLISQFLCPAENRRTDEYGGNLENRARFGLDILRRVKQMVPSVAVIFRLTVEDFFAGGMPFDEGRRVAAWADQAGADAIHVSAGHYRSQPGHMMIPPMAVADAPFLAFAAKIRKDARAPVIAVGRLGDPTAAAAAIDQGQADFVALGRGLIADPDWPRKVRRGKAIRRCLACNTCVNEMRGGSRLHCVVNGMVGREADFAVTRRPRDEKIAVVGAGPAGLTYASLVADDNRVTVFERSGQAGGAFRLVGLAPLFQDVEARADSFANYVRDMVAACRGAGVDFAFDVDVARTPNILAPFDRVVIASGARYRFGIGFLIRGALTAGIGRWPGFRDLAASHGVRTWFYERGRRPNGPICMGLVRPDQKLVIIGDAHRAGKSRPAIATAFEAALLDRHGVAAAAKAAAMVEPARN